MSTTTDEATPARTYGNWRRPQSAGLLGLGEGGTRLMFGGSIAVILIGVLLGRLTALLAALILGLILWALTREDRTGRNILERAGSQLRWYQSGITGENIHAVGPLVPTSTCRLPGLIGDAILSEYPTIHGEPFALLSYKDGHHVVLIDTHPTGTSGLDDADVNAMVAQWGGWMASQSTLDGLVGFSVVVTTSPDTGAGLRRTIDSSACANEPPLATRVHESIKQRYTVGSPHVRVIVTLTFDEKIRGKRKLSTSGERRDAVAEAISTELPDLLLNLRGTGAGSCNLLDALEVAEIERVAWDPAARVPLDDARAKGEPMQALSWDDAGPIGYHAHGDYLEHDGVYTTAAVMTKRGAPRHPVPALILQRMLSPQPGVLATRVAIHYRVLPLELAGTIAENDHKDANFNAGAKSGPQTAASKLEIDAVRKTAEEEAQGAGMVNFGIALSATVANLDDIEAAQKTLRVMAASAKLQTRIAHGQQPFAFALTQPLGLPNSLASVK